jgi:hypothetical protein
MKTGLKMSSANRKYDDSYIVAYLPEVMSDNIISWGYDHIACCDLFEDEDDPTFGRERDIHVTMLGPVEEDSLRYVTAAINSEPPVEITLGKIGLFKTNSKYDVVQIQIPGDEIHRLHRGLSLGIRNISKFPAYIPHVTIAYLKKGMGEKYLNDTYFEGQKFWIRELLFSHKSGRKYNIRLGIS